MTIDNIFRWFFLVVVTEAMTEIIVASQIFSGLRGRIRQLAHPLLTEEQIILPVPFKRRFFMFIDGLVSCGYCTSVWVAAFWGVFAPWVWWGDNYMMVGWIINWVIALLALHRLSNWLHVLASLVQKGRVRTYDIELKLTKDDHGIIGQGIGEGAESS